MTTLEKFGISKQESQQIKEEDRNFGAHGLRPVPFDPGRLLVLMENNVYFDACVRQVATDVTGQGWNVVLKEDATESKDELKRAKDFLDDPNKSFDTLEIILNKSVVDWGSIGWFGLEVARSNENLVNGLWHVPAQTIRVHKSETKYAQVKNEKFVWFKKFGSDVNLSRAGNETKGTSNKANEMIFYSRYYPLSEWYGSPPVLPSIGSVFGMIGVRDYNLAFFENYGIPAALVTLEGKWTEGSTKLISDFIDVEIKGSGNAHKTLVFELPSGGGSVKWQPLTVSTNKKEGSFEILLGIYRDEVLAAYRMHPYRIGIIETGELGGNIAQESTKIYIDSVVNPLKRELARIITKLILEEGLQVQNYEFKFGVLDSRNLDALAERWSILFGMGIINVDWMRKEFGLEALEDGLHGQDYYISNQYRAIDEAAFDKRTDINAVTKKETKRLTREAIEQIRKELK
jgi:PBSX family phage portal protein